MSSFIKNQLTANYKSQITVADQQGATSALIDGAYSNIFSRKYGRHYIMKPVKQQQQQQTSPDNNQGKMEYLIEDGANIDKQQQSQIRLGQKGGIDLSHFVKIEIQNTPNTQKVQQCRKDESPQKQKCVGQIDSSSAICQRKKIPMNGITEIKNACKLTQMRSSSASFTEDHLKINKISIPIRPPPLDSLQSAILTKLKMPVPSFSYVDLKQDGQSNKKQNYKYAAIPPPISPRNQQESFAKTINFKDEGPWKLQLKQNSKMLFPFPQTTRCNLTVEKEQCVTFANNKNTNGIVKKEETSNQISLKQILKQEEINSQQERMISFPTQSSFQVLGRGRIQELSNAMTSIDKENSYRKTSYKQTKSVTFQSSNRKKSQKKSKALEATILQNLQDKIEDLNIIDKQDQQSILAKLKRDDYLEDIGSNASQLPTQREINLEYGKQESVKQQNQENILLPSMTGLDDEADSIVKSSDLIPLKLSAKSICVFDVEKNKFIVGLKFKKSREIASLTKIMTCYIICSAIQNKKLNKSDSVKVSKAAASMIGTTAYLRSGDHLSVWDLLYGLMLPSGNDAAFALAEHYGRSLYFENEEGRKLISENPFCIDNCKNRDALKAFISEMNKISKELGLTSTHYANPHGLINKSNRSSALDICKLSAICMTKQPLFSQIVKTKQYTCQIKNKQGSIRLGQWENTNKCLLKYPSICSGIKTGVTCTAGPCLTTSWKVDGKHFIISILKCDTLEHRYSESHKIFVWLCEKLAIPLSDNEKIGYEQLKQLSKSKSQESLNSQNEVSTSSGSTK